MTPDNQMSAPPPTLLVVGGGADSTHALIYITFLDPDLGVTRQFNVEAHADHGAFTVTAAGSQAHLPGAEPFLAEATRIAYAFFEATFPQHTHEAEQP